MVMAMEAGQVTASLGCPASLQYQQAMRPSPVFLPRRALLTRHGHVLTHLLGVDVYVAVFATSRGGSGRTVSSRPGWRADGLGGIEKGALCRCCRGVDRCARSGLSRIGVVGTVTERTLPDADAHPNVSRGGRNRLGRRDPERRKGCGIVPQTFVHTRTSTRT